MVCSTSRLFHIPQPLYPYLVFPSTCYNSAVSRRPIPSIFYSIHQILPLFCRPENECFLQTYFGTGKLLLTLIRFYFCIHNQYNHYIIDSFTNRARFRRTHPSALRREAASRVEWNCIGSVYGDKILNGW
jgi:hypothetical protein